MNRPLLAALCAAAFVVPLAFYFGMATVLFFVPAIAMISRHNFRGQFRAALPAIAVALMLLAPALAFAQTTVTSTAPSETTINVGQLLAPWLQGLIAAVVSVIMALFGWLTIVINRRAGLESNAAVVSIEARAREALQSALTSAAGMIVMKAGPSLDKMVVDVKSPIIAEGIIDVNKWASDAVTRFGLTPDDIAKKLIEKIGVLTAANPVVTPTTPAAT